ncbi:MAG: hypothetical protein NUV60_03670 [Patescibacteria group bacterium]|nr:hypothetical protein [Patescibacteria group bacterium]
MKKTFLAKRNAILSSANLSWGTLALIFAVCVLCLRLLAPNLLLQLFAPAFGASNVIAAQSHSFFSSFSDAAALAARNDQLVSENAVLTNENIALEQRITDVIALAGSANIQKSATGILAGVVIRPPESPYDMIIVTAGERVGVTPGLEAFGGGGVPIGQVTSVTADFSRVTLFSTPGMVTRGWVGRMSVPIDIYGAGAGAFSASLSRSANVVVGDNVYVPGPGMLPIGSVVRIDGDPSATNVTLRIAPRTNPFSLTWIELRDTGVAIRNSFVSATSTAL